MPGRTSVDPNDRWYYILFDEVGGEFAFDCLTGSIHGSCDGDAVQFSWEGTDEMEPASPSYSPEGA